MAPAKRYVRAPVVFARIQASEEASLEPSKSAQDSFDPVGLIDGVALSRWLGKRVGRSGEIAISVLSAGRSNLTFGIEFAGGTYVLRRPPLGTYPARTHDMERESRVIGAIGQHFGRVPTVIGYSDDQAVAGAPFFIMDRCGGITIDGPTEARQVGRRIAEQISDDVAATLAAIHAIPIEGDDFAWLGKPEGFLERRVPRWLEQWHGSPHRDLKEVDEIAVCLLRQFPPEEQPAIVHGDYRLGNLLVEPTRGAVAAVLDWENATRGDPLTDLAHLLIYWERTRSRVVHPSQEVSLRPGFASGTELAESYADETGRSIEWLDYYLCLAHWRSAIIKEAIYQRSLCARTEPDDDQSFKEAVIDHLSEAAEICGSSGFPFS